MDSRFDDLLNTVITQKGEGIYGFFDTIFGFMYRRTDFFYEMAPGENMGFFPGQNEAIIYNFFKKYQNLHYKERVPKRNIDPKEIEEFMKNNKNKKSPKPNNPETIPFEKVENMQIGGNVLNQNPNITLPENTLTTKKDYIDLHKTLELKKETPEILNKVENNESKKKIDEKFENISTYNGDKCDNYSWSQGTVDVNIQVKLPENTTSSKVNFF